MIDYSYFMISGYFFSGAAGAAAGGAPPGFYLGPNLYFKVGTKERWIDLKVDTNIL